MPTPPVVTRFAPSPTGHLHIGGARTALFCWAFARRNQGSFILRIEDTDQARSSDESARGIMEDLAWLGIDWDQGPEFAPRGGRPVGGDPRGVGPFFQARRVPLYNEHLMQLVERGRAYPAFERSEDLEAKRKAAVAAKQTYRYDRAALREMPEIKDRLKRMESGEPHVIRLVAPAEEIVVHDEVLGDVTYAAGEMDDFVIRKADGFPTYHFAVVIDDELMGVTHVLRAQEHLNNTPRHVALQRALENTRAGRPFRTPVYAHMPLICNMDGSKMSKRDKAKAARATLQQKMKADASLTPAALSERLGIDAATIGQFVAKENDSVEVAGKIASALGVALPEIEVSDFRENGYLPGAITNFLSLLGWNPGMKTGDGKDLEKFDNVFLAEHFALDRIGKTSAKFDRAKLMSFNADAIGALPDAEFAAAWRAWAVENEPAFAARMDSLAGGKSWELLAAPIRPRAKTLRDGVKSAAVVMTDAETLVYDGAAVEKALVSNDRAGVSILKDCRGVLGALGLWEPTAIHGALEGIARARGFVNEKGVNIGPIAQPLRVAIAGVPVTPPLGETLAVLGKDSTLARIDRCVREWGS